MKSLSVAKADGQTAEGTEERTLNRDQILTDGVADLIALGDQIN